MKAVQTSIIQLLQIPNQQFVIPVYQRPYKWTKLHCTRLLNDIQKVSNPNRKTHFVGSIVYISDSQYIATNVKQLSIIDGQQRITTISLLCLAMSRYLDDHPEKSFRTSSIELLQYIINQYKQGEDYIKLRLTRRDKEVYDALVHKEPIEEQYHNLLVNYNFLYNQIKSEDLDIDMLHEGIARLMVVDVSLEREHDDPQLIFESLNSTGAKLTQADLIRNYLLMDIQPTMQKKLYDFYWYPIEQKLSEENGQLSDFIRDYLTVKNKKIPNKSSVYEEFKKLFEKSYSRDLQSIEPFMQELLLFANFYERMTKQIEKDEELNQYFIDLDSLEVKVAYPLLLRLYKDYDEDRLSKQSFIRIIELIESFVIRRLFCSLPTNAVSKVFTSILKDLDEKDYIGSVERIFANKKASQRFPNNDEFKKAFIQKDVYNLSNKNRKFILSKLENFNTKEYLKIDSSITIEHIMPQSKKLSDKWIKALGDNWKEVHNIFLHTIGNLTLTGYNSEMSNKFFTEKRDMKDGFRDSRARLNKGLRDLDTWNEQEIVKRAGSLFLDAVQIWNFPEGAVNNEEYKPILTLDDDWTGKKAKYFEFLGHRTEVRDFTQLYLTIISMIYELDSDTFIDTINLEEFQSRKFYFDNEEEFPSYNRYKIPSCDIYLNTTLSSESKRKNLSLLFEKMGLDEEDLVIYLD